MKNSNLRGARTVFRYTVQQHYKNVSVIIFLLFLFAVSIAAFPLLKHQFGKDEPDSVSVKTLYICNQTPYPFDNADITSDPVFAEVQIKETDADENALAEMLNAEAGADAAASVITLDEEKMAFTVSTYYGENGSVSSGDADIVNELLKEVLHNAVMHKYGVSEAQETLLHCKAVSQVAKIADYGGDQESNTDTHVFANMFYSYFVMILCMLSMGYIFQLCMEEKMSKLVESLLVSVSPTALLVGKVLAVTLFIFLGLGIIALGLTISFFISGIGADLANILKAAAGVTGFDLTSLHMSFGMLAIFILCVLLAYMIGAFLSGIVGSCCSKTEDTQSASLVIVMFMMLGYLSGTFAPMFESDAVNYFVSLFPVTSIFAAFPNFVCGKIGLPVFVLALILQAALALLLARTAGAVYRMMLLYRGNVPSPKQLFNMLREAKAAEKAAKENKHAN